MAPMWDVFLSYSHQDREQATKVESALEAKGFSVWRDHEIIPGENWLRAIEDAFAQARCVVVLWTPNAVSSEWVREEASLAREKKKLVPVLLEASEVPLPFRLIQMVDLCDWDGSADDPRIAQIGAGIQRCSGNDPSLAAPPGGIGATASVSPRRWRPLAFFLLPVVIVAVAAVGLMFWRSPADVSIVGTASTIQLHSPSGEPRVLLEPAKATSIGLRGFKSVSIAPEEVEVSTRSAATGVQKWAKLVFKGEFVLREAGLPGEETLSVKPLDGAGDSGLDVGRVFLTGGGVIFSAPDDSAEGIFSVRLDGLAQPGTIDLPGEFLMDVRHASLENSDRPTGEQALRFRIRMPAGRRVLRFVPADSRTVLQMGFRKGTGPTLANNGLPVDRVELVDTNAAGQAESTITGPGKIRYLDPAGVEDVPLGKGDWLMLGDLRDFRLRELALAEGDLGLRFRLQGTAGKISSGQPGKPVDRRLDWFDLLLRSRKLAALAIMLSAVGSALLGVWKFLREEKIIVKPVGQ